MSTLSFTARRGELETYFDRTASAAWARLTSTDKLGRIRQSVREGRARMRTSIAESLPAELEGCAVLDAGCGTGALAALLAARGADVTAIDLSETLVDLARSRVATPPRGHLRFQVGDMTDPALGWFDHVVAMDSLIHYETADVVQVVGALCARTRRSVVFTFAPHNLALGAMHRLGKLFPRGNRSPAIVPVRAGELQSRLAAAPELREWRIDATQRVSSGFYISQMLRLVRV